MAIKNKGGRPKGSPNILTSELRNLLKELLASELIEAEKILEECDLEKRIALFHKLGSILIPRQSEEDARMQTIEGEGEEEIEKITFNMMGSKKQKDEEATEPVPAALLKELAKEREEKREKGRPKGSLNKKTMDSRERMKQIFISEYHYIKANLKELEPEKRFDFILKVAKLITPYQTSKSIAEREEPESDECVTFMNKGKGWVRA